MQQVTIYHPYKDNHFVDPSRSIFYIIQHIASGKYYAGYKKNKKHFMVENGYCSSSKVVRRIISNEGLNAFRIMKIRYFDNALEAHNYEITFLKRINAMDNDRFYNLSNGSREFRNVGGYKLCLTKRAILARQNIAMAKIGTKLSKKTKTQISASLTGKKQSSETILKRISQTIGRKRTVTQRKRI